MKISSRKKYSPFLVLIFAFWMLLSPSFSILNLSLGLLSSLLVISISESIFGTDFPPPFPLTVFLRLPVFALSMVWEIIKANIDVARIVTRPALHIEPRIFQYKSRLRGDLEKALFTYCINITPGTVVVDIQGDTYFVHGLAPHHQNGLAEGACERLVAQLFGYELGMPVEEIEKAP